MKTNWKTIETKKEYEIALNRFQTIFHAAPKAPEENEAKLLALGEDYENKNIQIPEPDPKASQKFK